MSMSTSAEEPYSSMSIANLPGEEADADEDAARASAADEAAVRREFAASELAWTGRQRMAAFGAMLAGWAALASIIWVTGWRQQLGDTAYLLHAARASVASSSTAHAARERE